MIRPKKTLGPQPMTQGLLQFYLNYDPATGNFTWKNPCSYKMKVGDHAGSIAGHGYRQIKIAGKMYLAHRLAWLWVYGRWPVEFIDHKNCDKRANWIDNLREATRTQNGQNAMLRADNLIGLKGVTALNKSNKFGSSICVNGTVIWLGTFNTAEAAHRAYQDAAHTHFGVFSRTS